MHRSVRLMALLVVLMLAMALPAYAAEGGTGKGNASDRPAIGERQDRSSALVQLKGDPLATDPRTKPARGKKIDFNSETGRAARAQLSALRNDFKAWLRTNAPNARVTGEYDIALNAIAVQLNGESLDTIRTAPQVQRAEYEGLYYPLVDDPDLSLIDAVQAWSNAGGAANAGAGVKVAIVDTGIDVAHPCFSDAGYPAQQQFGDPKYTNNKVIAAKVFNNKIPGRGYTPEAIQDHGTHVAGTVACNYQTPATVGGVSIPSDISGVAPRALLGNYNIFPADVTNARSEDIMNALEAAYGDGFDVANLSLGGGASGVQDLLTMAVNNLDVAGMVVAVAAGNSGPGHDTVESPGSAARALTAGASTVPHFVGAAVTVNGATYGAASGDFATVQSDLSATLTPILTNGALDLACNPLTVDLTGQIAVVSRGSCTFGQKIQDAQKAGAAAVLVVNNVAGDPSAMAGDGVNSPTIPAYMVSLAGASDLIAAAGKAATIGASESYLQTANDNIMAGFSSQGPTDVDFRVKPDVVAPGVNVLSSIPTSYCGGAACFAFFQGTSMATPHLAGSAAVVRQQHPDWSAGEIRSAIVNTAQTGVLTNYKTGKDLELDVNVTGAGIENLDAATRATVALDPVSVSFGALPSGSGQARTLAVTLTNLSGSSQTFGLSTSTSGGVTFGVSPSSVSLAAGQSATVNVTMASTKRGTAGDQQGWLTVKAGNNVVAHAALYTLLK